MVACVFFRGAAVWTHKWLFQGFALRIVGKYQIQDHTARTLYPYEGGICTVIDPPFHFTKVQHVSCIDSIIDAGRV